MGKFDVDSLVSDAGVARIKASQARSYDPAARAKRMLEGVNPKRLAWNTNVMPADLSPNIGVNKEPGKELGNLARFI